MINLENVVQNFLSQNNSLGYRVRQAISYRDALIINEISMEEYHSLMTDLQRLDDIQLSAHELDQQIAFNNCIDMLKSLPLP